MTKIKIIPPQVCPEAYFQGESRFCQVDTINHDSEGKGGGQEDASLLVCLAAGHTVAPWCKDGTLSELRFPHWSSSPCEHAWKSSQHMAYSAKCNCSCASAAEGVTEQKAVFIHARIPASYFPDPSRPEPIGHRFWWLSKMMK